MTQTVAETLGIPMEMVTAKLGDSTLPSGALTGGSMSTAGVLPAVKTAADAVVEELKQIMQWNTSDKSGRLVALGTGDLALVRQFSFFWRTDFASPVRYQHAQRARRSGFVRLSVQFFPFGVVTPGMLAQTFEKPTVSTARHGTGGWKPT